MCNPERVGLSVCWRDNCEIILWCARYIHCVTATQIGHDMLPAAAAGDAGTLHHKSYSSYSVLYSTDMS